MISLKVEINDVAPMAAWLLAAPALADEELFSATAEGTRVMASAIAVNTPVRTGGLVGSEQTIIEKLANGARGRVLTTIRYGRFVEAGTREHGRAQRMFERGLRLSRSGVEDGYDRHIGRFFDTMPRS